MPTILLVDDDDDARLVLAGSLSRRGLTIVEARSAALGLEAMATNSIDVVVTDVNLGGTTGLELASAIVERWPDVPVLVMTAFGNMETVLAALRAGAYDFIAKPFTSDVLALAIDRAAQLRSLKSELRRLRERAAADTPLMLGESSEMKNVRRLISQIAASDATVLITGESGSGKELVARSVHDLSTRKDHPFIAVNCGAMPATLLESELFGYARGAFTDAKRDKTGLFVQADGGTLFLDEVGEMPVEMQVKLLRVLQERRVRPVGAEQEIPFDVRLVTATNRDLEAAVEDGRFRSDLYYRINVVHIEVPPLRARQTDVLLLAQRFVERIAARSGKAVEGISAPAAQKLIDYDWPGNVRELENSIERAVALTQYSAIGVDDLPSKVRDHQGTRMVIESQNPAELVTIEELERRYVRTVLAACSGNKTHAAKILGIDRRSLYRRLEENDNKPAAVSEAAR